MGAQVRKFNEGEYRRGKATYHQLSRQQQLWLSEALWEGDFNVLDWFNAEPHRDFLRGFLHEADEDETT